nr:unnamed protein product [Callosobruchus analis]
MVLQNTGKFRADRADKSTTKGSAQGNREETSEFRLRQAIENDAIDLRYGFDRIKDHQERTGFLLNMHSVCQNILPYFCT